MTPGVVRIPRLPQFLNSVLVRNMFCIISQSFLRDGVPVTYQESWLNRTVSVDCLFFHVLFLLIPCWDSQHILNKRLTQILVSGSASELTKFRISVTCFLNNSNSGALHLTI